MSISYWCCAADFGKHMPSCKNYVPTELEKAIEEVKERNEKEFGWQPKDVAEIPPAVPGQGAKL